MGVFANVALSTENYDTQLIGWDRQDLQPIVTFSSGNSIYDEGIEARMNMINTDGWDITDLGYKNENSYIPLIVN